MEFDCTSCGLCCEHVSPHPDVEAVDGTCVKFDKASRRCSDYENRPRVCNVCASYDDFKDKYTEEEYLKVNYQACEYLKKTYGEGIRI